VGGGVDHTSIPQGVCGLRAPGVAFPGALCPNDERGAAYYAVGYGKAGGAGGKVLPFPHPFNPPQSTRRGALVEDGPFPGREVSLCLGLFRIF